MKHWPYLLTLLVMGVIFGSRWFGPSDLYDNDQPKTVAYTVDMVRHGHWVLPVDMLGRPATKPPMYNWIGAPAVAADWHNEFALKLPSTLAAWVMLLATWVVARSVAMLVQKQGDIGGEVTNEGNVAFGVAFAATACIALLANYSVTKLIYTARPDMVLTGFLTVGLVAATAMLWNSKSADEKDAKPRAAWGVQLVLWLSVAGAALTKGPPALLLVIYVVLGGKLIAGRWPGVRRTGILWGLPLAMLLFGAWAYGAYLDNAQHFMDSFLGYETTERLTRGGPWKIVAELWKMPALFMARFFPWSIFALMGAWHVVKTKPRRAWFSSATGPAMLWVLIVIVFFSLSGGKRADYLAPAYPAGAVLAAYWLMVEGPRLWKLRPWQPAAAGLVFAVVLGVYECGFSPAAVDGYGDRAETFVHSVNKRTQNKPIHFEQTGYTPIQSLLGYNQPPNQHDDATSAPWTIKPADGGHPEIVSGLLTNGGGDELKLGLYADPTK